MADVKTARPLSPHLQVYRMTLTMAMSIVHRITGIALAGGILLLVWWLAAAASSNDDYFNMVQGLFGSILGRIVLLGFTWALVHHALGGLRHFIWDTGHGFDLPKVEWLAQANLIAAPIITAALWLIAYWVRA